MPTRLTTMTNASTIFRDVFIAVFPLMKLENEFCAMFYCVGCTLSSEQWLKLCASKKHTAFQFLKVDGLVSGTTVRSV